MELILLSRSIHPLHGYGGMERHCHDWIEDMVTRGCRIHVVTMPPVHAEALSGFSREVSFYFIPGKPARRILPRITSYPRWVERAGAFLRQLLPSTGARAVYAHGLAAAGCEGLAAPVLYNPHGMEEFKTGGLKYAAYAPFRNLSRRAARLATRVIATDRTLIPEIVRFLNVEEERIALIPNATPAAGTSGESALIPIQGSPLFLSVGRLESNKGFHILIEAFSRARRLPPDWKLILAGAGSREESLKQLAARKGLRGKIAFLGVLSEVELVSLYSRADVFVNPTLYEGSSIVTLEAMRARLPVIASRTGGLPDKVLPGKNGWLVAPGDPDALALALEQACAASADWKSLGDASFDIWQTRYSWKIVGAQFLQLVESLSTSGRE